jgi:hypothetical protein
MFLPMIMKNGNDNDNDDVMTMTTTMIVMMDGPMDGRDGWNILQGLFIFSPFLLVHV